MNDVFAGSIEPERERASGAEPCSTGDITVWLPQDAKLVVRTATGEVKWGHGGPELRIDSGRGDVRVVAYPGPG